MAKLRRELVLELRAVTAEAQVKGLKVQCNALLAALEGIVIDDDVSDNTRLTNRGYYEAQAAIKLVKASNLTGGR